MAAKGFACTAKNIVLIARAASCKKTLTGGSVWKRCVMLETGRAPNARGPAGAAAEATDNGAI